MEEIAVYITGDTGAGKTTLAGCLLYKLNGIDLEMKQNLEMRNISSYAETARHLNQSGHPMICETPRHKLRIHIDGPPEKKVYVLLYVVDVGQQSSGLEEQYEHLAKVIVVANKMDSVNWSSDTYQHIVDMWQMCLGSSQTAPSISYVPFCALNGEHLLEPSTKVKDTWRNRDGQPPREDPDTLLAVLDSIQ